MLALHLLIAIVALSAGREPPPERELPAVHAAIPALHLVPMPASPVTIAGSERRNESVAGDGARASGLAWHAPTAVRRGTACERADDRRSGAGQPQNGYLPVLPVPPPVSGVRVELAL